jgi:hypothetical protein
MRLVRAYAAQQAPQPVAVLHDPYARLRPGETDTARQVTRCVSCREVRDLTMFEDGRPVCIECSGRSVTCTGCGKVKAATPVNFPLRRDSADGLRHQCRDCTSRKLETCRDCGDSYPHRDLLRDGRCGLCRAA